LQHFSLSQKGKQFIDVLGINNY